MTQDIKSTKDYDQFSFLPANRDIVPSHVERLKKAFIDRGNLLAVEPIIVNEHLAIIDGQNRFQAAKELGETVYYREIPGLRVEDAQQMNILHHSWVVSDYAKTYAVSGVKSYQDYLRIREEYPQFAHKIILTYTISGYTHARPFADFREGEYQHRDLDEARHDLDLLTQVWNVVPFHNSGLAEALLVCFHNEDYDQSQMLRKIISYGDRMLKAFNTKEDNLRQLEEVYNMHMQNKIRLY